MSNSSTFSLRGVADLRQKLVDLTRETKENLSLATQEEAERIAEISRNERVPVDTGNLASTIRVISDDSGLKQGRNVLGQFTSEAVVEVKIIAGDETTPQALAIHEHPSGFDPPSWEGVNVQFQPSGRGPKYLQGPLDESIGGMAERVGSKVIK